MWSRLLSSWAILAVLAGSTIAGGDKHETAKVIAAMDIGLNVSIMWRECKEQNAYWYGYPVDVVVLCKELEGAGSGVIRFLLAHELGHAIIEQKRIPFTGSEEQAADELAMLFLAGNGWEDDILAAAAWFEVRKHRDDPWITHPEPKRRAFYLRCFAQEMAGVANHKKCSKDHARLVYNWLQLLNLE